MLMLLLLILLPKKIKIPTQTTGGPSSICGEYVRLRNSQNGRQQRICMGIQVIDSRSLRKGKLISFLIIKPTRVPLVCSHLPHVQGTHSLTYVKILGTSHAPPLNT